MDLEPGPIVREPMPFGRRVSRDGLLTGYLWELEGTLGASDPGLGGISARVGDGVPQDLPGTYDATVGRAEDAHSAQAGAGSGSVADVLIGSGGNIDALRGSVLGYLPQPGAPIDTSFVDPPDIGVAFTGRGFNSVTTPPPPDTPHPPGPPPGDIAYNIVREQVRRLYVELLNREPDPDGWESWTQLVLTGAMTIDGVRAGIMNSDEYRAIHGG